mmetsp:Transcript_18600/g.25805  ORF Transcript_18600/g.25805 Transcript_18600/m.25805 type:complete len:451 (+) Transcript_18600:91-1443(+)
MAMLRQRQGSGAGGRGGSLPSNYGNGGGGLGVGYGGGSYDNPNAHYSTGKTKRPSHTASPFLNSKVLVTGLSIFLLFCSTLYYRSSANSVTQGIQDVMSELRVKNMQEAVGAIKNIMTDRDRLMKQSRNNRGNSGDTNELNDRIRELELTNSDLTVKNKKLEKESTNKGLSEASKMQLEKLSKREGAWRRQIGTLQAAASRNSHRSVLEKFGPGPHRVKFAVRFSENDDNLEHFVVEMAPLELMPHAVHLFLEQVYHELWDYTWIYLNGPHVLQAGPQSYEDEEEDEMALKAFEDEELDELAFPEYNAKFPHRAWTLGFTGRPGGPDFYINKNDNTHVHGPGGQTQHAISEQADTCFAKVVDGYATLQKIFKMDVYDDAEYADFLESPVEIAWARIETVMPEQKKPQQTPEEIVAKHRQHHHDSKHKPKLDHRFDQHKEEYDELIEDVKE